eukprot:m51a1_g3486 hypothetical protein (333) ;mRNA; f:785338-788313
MGISRLFRMDMTPEDRQRRAARDLERLTNRLLQMARFKDDPLIFGSPDESDSDDETSSGQSEAASNAKMAARSALVLVVLVVAANAVPAVPCTAKIVDKAHKKAYTYDLTPLYHDAGQDDVQYTGYIGGKNVFFYVNFCGPTTTSATSYCNSMAVCSKGSSFRYYGGGLVTSQQILKTNLSGVSSGDGVMVTYANGEACETNPQILRSTIIYVNCDKKATAPGEFYEASESSNQCAYTLKMKSPVAGCGKPAPCDGCGSSGMGAGGIILIILAVLVVVYLVGGCFYNYRFREIRTFPHMIPNLEFWVMIPGLVKDGACFAFHGFKKGDYVTV